MLRFACRSCGQKMKVPDEYAGKKVRCSGCKEAIRVPVTKSAEGGTSQAPAAKSRSKSSAAGTSQSSASASGMAVLDRPASDAGGLDGLDDSGEASGISLADLAAMEAAAPVGPVQHGGGTSAKPGQQTCPSCGKYCKDDAKLCVQCGFDFDSGRQLKTKKKNAKNSASSAFGGVAKSAAPSLEPAWGKVIAGVICLALGVAAMLLNFDPGDGSDQPLFKMLHLFYAFSGHMVVGGVLALIGVVVCLLGLRGNND